MVDEGESVKNVLLKRSCDVGDGCIGTEGAPTGVRALAWIDGEFGCFEVPDSVTFEDARSSPSFLPGTVSFLLLTK